MSYLVARAPLVVSEAAIKLLLRCLMCDGQVVLIRYVRVSSVALFKATAMANGIWSIEAPSSVAFCCHCDQSNSTLKTITHPPCWPHLLRGGRAAFHRCRSISISLMVFLSAIPVAARPHCS